ncbi:hypothetical protein AUJ13_04450 [Candidatus Micrarchaeota archaeon CG1_02_49_24]|nr:MAG: hypothetical protein AUJ13_04450 [Candidatus Micrarchaeota archaeon CG1_02_49_24]
MPAGEIDFRIRFYEEPIEQTLSARAIAQQRDSIGDNSRRDFHPQVIDASRRRDMLQQEHLKSQQAIGDSSRRAMHHLVHSTVSKADSTQIEPV